MDHAAAKKYRVESWTLSMPATLSAPERRWWERKAKAWRKEYPAVRIDLWDEPALRGRLLAPDAAHVFAEFYGPARDWSAHPATLALPSPAAGDPPEYEDVLFMRQLEAAGATETDAQRLAYFSAELLVRDVAARAVPAQLAALRGLDHEVHATWEERFNDPATAPTDADYWQSALRLLAAVLRAVRDVPAPAAVPALPQHLRGLLHRVVEDGRAGWVWDWRDVAELHRSRAARPVAAGGGVPAPAAAQAAP